MERKQISKHLPMSFKAVLKKEAVLFCHWLQVVFWVDISFWEGLTCLMRLSIIRVNWEICCNGQRMFAAGMHSCANAVHFHPRGFALPWLVALPFGLPHPPTSWFMVGFWCSGTCKYTYSPLRISVWQVAAGDDPWGLPWLPLYLHFAHICSLSALLSIGTYPPFFITAYRQVNKS